MNKHPFIFIILFFMAGALFAQESKQIELKHADILTKTKGKDYQKLVGNVAFFHEGATMTCDSAYRYINENSFEAYGKVRIRQGDSVQLDGRFLHYDGNTKLAIIKENVVLTDRKMTISTDRLHFDRKQNLAYYTTGAKIVDSANTLNSQRGYYHTETKDIFFKKDVALHNTDFDLFCDTLQYNVNTRMAYFLSPTTINGEDTKMYTEDGWYSTNSHKLKFIRNAYIFSEENKIFGDTLYYEDETEYAKAIGNVRFIDTANTSELRGQYAEHFDQIPLTYITDSALFIDYMDTDTMYLHADTLKIIKDSNGNNDILLAYHGVRSYGSDMQFRCDSMVYFTSDSVIHFHYDPVIWQENSQITSEKMQLYMKNEKVDHMEFQDNCFIVEMIDSIRFNQVKGREMVAKFQNNQIERIDVEGNAESIYFLTDEEDKFVGMNKNQSSNIYILMEDKKIKTINFIVSPTGNVYPPSQMDQSGSKLEGFIWRNEDRPASINDLFFL